jgi:flagellar protein FlaG
MNLDAIRTPSPRAPAPDVAAARRSPGAEAVPGAAAPAAQEALSGPRATAKESPSGLLDERDLIARVQEAAPQLDVLNRSLSFRVHEGTGELMVQIVDRVSGRVLRETPPEEFLHLVTRLQEMVGLFLDETR